jgi:hypothetical protein
VQVQHLERIGPQVAANIDPGVPHHPLGVSTALLGATHSRVIDQDLTHDARHEGEQMRTVDDLGLRSVEQLDERLVDERRRL